MANLEDNDKFLVTRGEKSYHITGKQMIKEFGGAGIPDPILFNPLKIVSTQDTFEGDTIVGYNGAELTSDPTTDVIAESGVPPYTYTYQWVKIIPASDPTDDPTEEPQELQQNCELGVFNSYTVTEEDVDTEVGIYLTKYATDSLDNESKPISSDPILAQNYYKPPVCTNPSGDVAVDGTELFLEWENGIKYDNIEPDSVEVEMSTDDEFQGNYSTGKFSGDFSIIKASTLNGGNLMYDQEYYWRVKNNYALTNGDHTEVSEISTFTTGNQTRPDAVMYGLRFDSERNTFLDRSLVVDGNRKVFTLSLWIKRAVLGTPQRILSTQIGSNEFIRFDADNTLLVFETFARLKTTQTFTDHLWHHLTVAVDTTQTTDSNRVKVWIDGDKVTSFSTSTYPAQNADSPFNKSGITYEFGTGSGTTEHLDSYLSDVYFVDGQALDAEVFGRSFGTPGRWGPLDSSVVKNNISNGVKSPHLTCPNFDQKWSDNLTSPNGSGGERNKLSWFDGNLLTTAYVSPDNNGELIWAPPGGMDFNKMDVWGDTESGNRDGIKYKLAGQSEQSLRSPEANVDAWMKVPGPGKLEYLKVTRNGGTNLNSKIGAVKIDDRLLIDGPADYSKMWSDFVTIGNGVGIITATNAAKGFDGDPATGTYGKQNGSEPRFTYPIPKGTKVKCVINNGNDGGASGIISDSIGKLVEAPPAGNKQTVTFTAPRDIDYLQFSLSDNGFGAFYQIFLDDVILLNPCARWNTSQVWSEGMIGEGTDGKFTNKPSLAFDGNKDTFSNWKEVTSQKTVVTQKFDDIPVEKFVVKFHAGRSSDKDDDDVLFSVNGGPFLDPVIEGLGTEEELQQDPTWNVTADLSSYLTEGILSSFAMTRRGDFTPTGHGLAMYYVELDGEILVDAAGFGENGFYLPFEEVKNEIQVGPIDSITTGEPSPGLTWSNFITIGPYYVQHGPVDTTYSPNHRPCNMNLPNGFTPDASFSTDNSFTGFSGNNLPTSDIGDIVIFTMDFDRKYPADSLEVSFAWHASQGQEDNAPWVYLSDGDAKGPQKHLLWNNWSAGGWPNTSFADAAPPSGVFNRLTMIAKRTVWPRFGGGPVYHGGAMLNGVWINGQKLVNGQPIILDTTRFVFDPSANVDLLQVGDFIKEVGGDNSGQAVIVDVDAAAKTVDTTGIEGNWEAGSFTEVTNRGVVVGVDNSGKDNHFLDKNFILVGSPKDSVLDTPMNNYAVLRTGKNGNLVDTDSKINLTYVGSGGIKYYYEVNGVGAIHNGGTVFESYSGSTYNFGQQPFIDVGPQGNEQTLYQTWDQWATTRLGGLNKRIAELEQQQSQDQETISTLKTDIDAALVRLQSITENEEADDTVDANLILLINQLTSRVSTLESN